MTHSTLDITDTIGKVIKIKRVHLFDIFDSLFLVVFFYHLLDTLYSKCNNQTNIHNLKLVEDYMTKKIMLDEFITNHFPFERINDAIDVLHKGEGLRSVLNIGRL
uniref:ADH_N domain-containing protein n=1 Tax=Heterorhabditis bacteriophora TaxID=37862 RepID=A0A1I7XER7_HETBA